MENVIVEFAKLILPAAAVLYAMYLVVKSFLDKDMSQRLLEIKFKNAETLLPIRLQAYERISLLLERITPSNLLPRLNDQSYSAPEFQQILTFNIREEYNHNLSQQIYVSDQLWELTTNAVEEVVSTINQAAQGLSEDAQGIDLARKTFELQSSKQNDPISVALVALKNEVRTIF